MFFCTTETLHVPMDMILWIKDGHAYMHTLTYGILHQNAYRPLPTTKTFTDLKNAYLLLVSLPPRKRLPISKSLTCLPHLLWPQTIVIPKRHSRDFFIYKVWSLISGFIFFLPNKFYTGFYKKLKAILIFWSTFFFRHIFEVELVWCF